MVKKYLMHRKKQDLTTGRNGDGLGLEVMSYSKSGFQSLILLVVLIWFWQGKFFLHIKSYSEA